MSSLKLACAATLALAAAGCRQSPSPAPLLVSAASDLQDVFTEFGRRFEAETGAAVSFNFGASGLLAQQIKSGARVDLFAAANIEFVNQLEDAGLILPETKIPYARGRLVAWSREDSKAVVHSLKDLSKPKFKRIALANPVTAPYGIAAREALVNVGVWEGVQDKLVYGENVRQTLELARSGNVDVALVSLSLTIDREGKGYLVPEGLHPPIHHGLAVIKGAANEVLAKRFIDILRRDDGRALLKEYGFSAVGPNDSR